MVGLQQYRKDGKLAFSLMCRINGLTDYQATHIQIEGDKETVILASARGGFSVPRIITEGKIRKNYHNSEKHRSFSEIDKNVYYSDVKRIKDSTALMNNRNIMRLINQNPQLIQIDHLDDKQQRVKSYNYLDGKLVGLDVPEIQNEKTVSEFKKTTGESYGVVYETEDGMLTRISTNSGDQLYGYNQDKKPVEHNTFKDGKLIYATKNFYENGKIIRREYEDLVKNERINYNFTYNDKGKFDTIIKDNGKKKTIFTFDYTYWQ